MHVNNLMLMLLGTLCMYFSKSPVFAAQGFFLAITSTSTLYCLRAVALLTPSAWTS